MGLARRLTAIELTLKILAGSILAEAPPAPAETDAPPSVGAAEHPVAQGGEPNIGAGNGEDAAAPDWPPTK